MSKDYRNCILDMLEAANKILFYCKGTTETGFCQDELLMDAVQRQIIIIGEAARAFPRELQEKYQYVEWGKSLGFAISWFTSMLVLRMQPYGRL